SASAARFPLQVKALLEKGLALRDRYNQGELSRHGLWTATGRLEAQLDRLLVRPVRDSANRRLKNHLWRERPYLFTFLYCSGLDATNNPHKLIRSPAPAKDDSIYLSLLSWSGCDQQCCRARFATAGGGAQELGWESNRKRSACASRAHQHPANGPTAREEPAGSADRLTGGEGPGQDSRPGAAHPRNTSGFLAWSSTS